LSNYIETEKFDRSKIYEKLATDPQPLNYSGNLPWIVQQQIAATNGKHYTDRIGKLKDYPVYKLPVPKVESGLMLDIGNGWGRWLIAGANRGYIPIGIDIRLEFCETALHTLKAQGKNGYSLVADLKNIPFKSGIFNLVWSFSVIQHTHKSRLINCLEHINRIIKTDGYAFLEFPNKHGIKNRFGNVQATEAEKDDYNSWNVRYYSIDEYREFFKNIFGNFSYKNHSLIGIGILKDDLKYVSFKNKILSGISLLGSMLTKIIPGLTKISDSIYIKVYKNKNTPDDVINNNSVALFNASHNLDPTNNLNIIHILRCPVTGESLKLSDDKLSLISSKAGIRFPIVNNIPILIQSEAVSL
jgi:SAM-dependent methyltransferase/uncharacterized protein YbaR (Trm112 family)